MIQVLVLALGVFILSKANQADFLQIALGYAVSFMAYFFIINNQSSKINLTLFLFVGVCLRVYLVFVFPNLSDDIYRFFWDGQLSMHGINPYRFLPETLLGSDQLPSTLNESIYSELNSQSYYSIYPPIGQLSFYLAAFSNSITGFSVILKSIYLIGECLCIFYVIKHLRSLQLESDRALIYFLNPLVIIEGVGNLHAEILMMPFLAYCLYALSRQAVIRSAFGYVLAIATKLTPLLLGPLILFYLYQKEKIFKFIAIGFLLLVALCTPLWFGLNFANLGDSVDLYFRKFEFNASAYYIFRAIGYWKTGYNQINEIGPSLALITIGLILYFSKGVDKKNMLSFIAVSIFCYLTYLLLATTVHPWYLVPLILCACFVKSWTVLVWSCLITLSYYTYSTSDWQESPLILFIQYLPVYYLFFCELSLGERFRT